jgi:bacterioferritin-associated ferredoxin
MPHREKPVRACICYPCSFALLKMRAESEGWTTLEDIAHATQCGTGCGTCRPYLQKMLETGETAFDVIWPPAPWEPPIIKTPPDSTGATRRPIQKIPL